MSGGSKERSRQGLREKHLLCLLRLLAHPLPVAEGLLEGSAAATLLRQKWALTNGTLPPLLPR